MKVANLEGALLDYWVARALGHAREDLADFKEMLGKDSQYSSDWARGGPIIARAGIELQFGGHTWLANVWPAESSNDLWSGSTPLIAVMRCFVASKFGEEVTE